MMGGVTYDRGSAAERLWRRVQRTDTCWLWTGALMNGGYPGTIRDGERRVMAHRLAYELAHGPIPDGLELDHLCRVRRCVRPSHLEPVTPRINTVRREHFTLDKGATCRSGRHLVAEVGVYVSPKGARACNACRREAWQRRDAQRAEKRVTYG